MPLSIYGLLFGPWTCHTVPHQCLCVTSLSCIPFLQIFTIAPIISLLLISGIIFSETQFLALSLLAANPPTCYSSPPPSSSAPSTEPCLTRSQSMSKAPSHGTAQSRPSIKAWDNHWSINQCELNTSENDLLYNIGFLDMLWLNFWNSSLILISFRWRA